MTARGTAGLPEKDQANSGAILGATAPGIFFWGSPSSPHQHHPLCDFHKLHPPGSPKDSRVRPSLRFSLFGVPFRQNFREKEEEIGYRGRVSRDCLRMKAGRPMIIRSFGSQSFSRRGRMPGRFKTWRRRPDRGCGIRNKLWEEATGLCRLRFMGEVSRTLPFNESWML